MPGSGSACGGFNDPVMDSQKVFMASLKALAYPGSILDLPVLPAGPKPFLASTTSLLLTLLDRDTPLWLDPPARNREVLDWLSFYCGCPLPKDPARAHFALITEGESLPRMDRFNHGAEESPEESATIIIQVRDLAEGEARSLAGPGIQERTGLSVEGLDDSFWACLDLNAKLYPQGLDFFLVGPGSLCGLPRTTSGDF